jgi:hypothetical protein
VYSRPSQADLDRGSRTGLNHFGSEQFRRLELGDLLWLVTSREGRLFLLGPLSVDGKGSTADAARALGLKQADLYKATFHVWQSGPIQRRDEVDITSLAEELRFHSKSDRLLLTERGLNPQQMQAMRWLTAESHDLLRRAWEATR